MPEPKRPLKVFLCHASADKPAVRSLYKRLVADGVDVWLDAESLVAGQNWQVEIPKAICESDVVIVCLSEKSINKEGYVQREIKFALDVADEKPEGTIFIVPAKLEECSVPDRLGMYHWVELFEKDGYERLLRALRLRADKIDATLQIKKNWLPNISSSPKKSVEVKKTIAKKKNLLHQYQR
ncbi:MAG: TIR domain-containing protein [Anaerolineales bacterium]|nr:TIR domain-containing protein [Anaerolineales bacterium]